MTRYRRTAVGAIAALGLVLAAPVAGAHSGDMGGKQGGQDGMHGGKGGMHSSMGGHAGKGGRGMGVGQQLMTPEERTGMREKMRAARSPEERQALAAANRAEMEKRAKDKGITLPNQRSAGGGMGSRRWPGAGGHQH